MRAALRVLSASALVLLLPGCGTYLEAKRNTAVGGQNERDIATANSQLSSAQAQNASLAVQKQQRERDIEANNKRIRALEADLKKQDAALASALKARQLTQARYNELKKEMDAVKAETQSVDLQNKGDALAAPDTKADAAKEAKLKDLERRRKDLESALAALTKS